ncbi:glycine cleavage system H protein [Odoribacter splanchnicus]|uniref:Glycine cleavage system H protein n=1 Tax=Odoribacter splanchnicus TaxID=28118 RepID=A0A413I7R6_9BACT|nr:glycine cleavage system H protein [Odoribacter sp.]RGY03912.1 glycine cleavage system H protein [Odoribacter splanchnicus]RHA42765.1 glycine cleavage system H protein [Odoribacter splanchnicus]RHA76208.1 glycine cleavage system H protein [Odoribacter splanchnicus]RHL84088.1 glycine cleavage system H protein [Odoribacter splanchnicus]
MFVVSGKGSPSFYGGKVGVEIRLDDNLHTSISLQVVFSP